MNKVHDLKIKAIFLIKRNTVLYIILYAYIHQNIKMQKKNNLLLFKYIHETAFYPAQSRNRIINKK